MICGLPSKILVVISFNLALYFLSNLRREPGAFFVFVLFSFFSTLTMSSIFRTIAAVSRTLAQALAPAAIFMLALIIYTGFVIPASYMKPWFRWMNYVNPVAYAFESLMINEFHNRDFPCSAFVPSGPGYDNATGLQRTCGTTGSVAGSSFVNGDNYINESFQYYAAHKWRCDCCLLCYQYLMC
jgi:ATP-binding cassette subfamily G (WHITE) protein 2 (PDR)